VPVANTQEALPDSARNEKNIVEGIVHGKREGAVLSGVNIVVKGTTIEAR
jgi:hypothetical protein